MVAKIIDVAPERHNNNAKIWIGKSENEPAKDMPTAPIRPYRKTMSAGTHENMRMRIEIVCIIVFIILFIVLTLFFISHAQF